MQNRFHPKRQFLAQTVYVQLGFTLLFNTAIALLLHVLIKGSLFWNAWLISQCIGLTIFFSFYIFSHFTELKGWRLVIPLTMGAIAGVALSVVVSGMRNGLTLEAIRGLLSERYEQVLVNLFLAFFFGFIAMYFFISRERHFLATQALKESQIKNLDHKKQIVETRLQLLQAQIEPHFLFNSLSNVISLIEIDPSRAKLMLESLTRYLRSSLTRSHVKDGTLKDELDLIENYLKIIQIRMAGRLSYKIDVDEALWPRPFPIMILQPLVENAILHGLEPRVEGGEITISARRQDGRLQIKVGDDGVGLKNGDLKGFGLMNVRQRLNSLYGETAALQLQDNIPCGVLATMEIPDA